MQTIPIDDQDYRASDLTGTLSHDDPALASVVRIRFISDPGFPMWDLSYIWGLDADGNLVRVIHPALGQIAKSKPAGQVIKRWPAITKLVKSGYVLNVLSLCQ